MFLTTGTPDQAKDQTNYGMLKILIKGHFVSLVQQGLGKGTPTPSAERSCCFPICGPMSGWDYMAYSSDITCGQNNGENARITGCLE